MARKILLADDSVTAQNMGRRILTDAGYEVITVNNGSAALKKIAEQKPDLVVLDVYMPGYGGLEVCQRIKETRETARIPVLLTVGKLEPFKPEEARRVRADAFIVKPFDVTELLAALTKLEDKIIPQPETYKPGRFAKAIAAVESDPGERFGNAETGWKNRIIIPTPGTKPEESEPVPHVTSTGTAFRDLGRGEDFKPAEPKSGFERPIPIGLPPDITPEEIAAITAAAAAFEKPIAQTGTVTQESKVEPAAQVETPKTEFSAAQAGSEETAGMVQSAREERRKGERRDRRESKSENTYGSGPSTTPESHPEASGPANEVASVSSTDQPRNNFEEAKQQEADQPAAPADAEVAAALAFLAPAKPEGDATHTGQGSLVEQEHWASYGSTGPRWVAEQIAVDEQEATLPLDREVDKTHAAFAAALANVDVRPEAVSDSSPPSDGLQNSIQESVSAAAETAAAAGAVANIQPDALFYSAPIAEITESTFVPDTTPADTTPTEPENLASPARDEGQAAYAAAASAGTSGAEPENNREMKLLPAPSDNSSDGGTPEPGDRLRESEMAAAWANWKHIRESIVGSESTSHVEDANAGYRDSGKEDPPSSPMSNEDASSAEDTFSSEPVQTEASEIASIVDTMLAELKPKLMEEIAKKMDTEKKGKKRKKD